MLGETGLSAAKPCILPKNYHIGVYGTPYEPYTGAVIRYAITDRTLFSPQDTLRRLPRREEGQAELVRRCGELARGGIDFIQLREKDLSPDELVHLGKAVLAAIRACGGHTRLLVNVSDDLSAALSIGADGVHLTSKSPEIPWSVERRFREEGLPKPFVSVSCHTLNEVRLAKIMGASAMLYGPIFGKTVKGQSVQDGIGTHSISDACLIAWPTPVLTLGGVSETNASACLVAGAAGIAAIRAFMLSSE